MNVPEKFVPKAQAPEVPTVPLYRGFFVVGVSFSLLALLSNLPTNLSSSPSPEGEQVQAASLQVQAVSFEELVPAVAPKTPLQLSTGSEEQGLNLLIASDASDLDILPTKSVPFLATLWQERVKNLEESYAMALEVKLPKPKL